jgi:hypothetical protein
MNNNYNEILELQKEVHNQLKNSTEKFSYYIIGLSVSSLAFIIYQTKDDLIDYPKILLLSAVLFWSFSIYFGFQFIKCQQHGLSLSYLSYDNLRNTFPPTKNNPEKIQHAERTFKSKISEVSNKSKRSFKFQLNCFFYSCNPLHNLACF